MTRSEGGKIASADDPKHLIEQVFAMGDEFPGPAEDLLLSWMLSLAPEADAPQAARRLADCYESRLRDVAENRPLRRLWRLLRETAMAKNERGRRRGGANGRRS